MGVRAVRGAITVAENNSLEILEATKELLLRMQESNGMSTGDIASAIFTVTNDLDAVFPSAAARQLGWNSVPLMCAREIDVPGSLQKCIRILIHINTDKSNEEIRHVYLKGAKVLRPDLSHFTEENVLG